MAEAGWEGGVVTVAMVGELSDLVAACCGISSSESNGRALSDCDSAF
jgi:hypothetical protein